jgi:hypothetical protein
MSAASAVNSKGAFWFATYEGGLSAEWFVTLLSKLMFNRRNALHRSFRTTAHYAKADCASNLALTLGDKKADKRA